MLQPVQNNFVLSLCTSKFNKYRLRPYAYLWLGLMMVVLYVLVIYGNNDAKGFLTDSSERRFNMEFMTANPLKKSNSDAQKDTEIPGLPVQLLIVTLWRSGSTWLGQIVSRTPNSFYVYEPIHMLINNTDNDLGLEIPEAEQVSVVKGLFHCGVGTRFLRHYMNWTEIYPKMMCYKPDCPPFVIKEVVEECVNADYRIIKTVRMSLNSVEEMMVLPSFRKLKVLFLVRDPRGTMKSMSNLASMSEMWNVTAEEICSRMRVNIWSYRTLKSLFPDRMFFMRYEDIAFDPFRRAEELWQFLQDDTYPTTPMPQKWVQYLTYSQSKKNTSNADDRPFAIHLRSTKDWEDWRKDIPKEVFQDTQKHCKDVIEYLGYNNFKEFKDVNDFSLSSIKRVNCTTLPCL